MTEFQPNLTQRIVRKARRRITPDWRSRARDYSSIALALGAALVAAWTALPADLKDHLPVDYVAWLVGFLNAFGLAGKFVIQGPVKDEDA